MTPAFMGVAPSKLGSNAVTVVVSSGPDVLGFDVREGIAGRFGVRRVPVLASIASMFPLLSMRDSVADPREELSSSLSCCFSDTSCVVLRAQASESLSVSSHHEVL